MLVKLQCLLYVHFAKDNELYDLINKCSPRELVN